MNPCSPDLFFVGRRFITAQSHCMFRAEPDHPLGSVARVVTSPFPFDVTDPVLFLLAYWIHGQFPLFSGDRGFVSLISCRVRIVSVCSFLSEPLPTISFDCVWRLPVLQPRD